MNTNNSNEPVKIGITGDVMIGRMVDQITTSKHNYDYIWGDMAGILKSTNFNLINLETTLTNSTLMLPKVFHFKASPDKIKSLTSANIKACNLANNHILDYSESGMLETIATLEKAHIQHVGAGKNIYEAQKPIIIEVNHTKIGIIGATDNQPEWEATKSQPGTHYINTEKNKEIFRRIRELSKKVDFVIFTMHWGPNMVTSPPKHFQKFAHKVIESGAKIFHGHSAHVFQGIEKYRKGIILYDTGDFIDDYNVDTTMRNDLSLFYIFHIRGHSIKQLELIPIKISNMQVNKARGIDFVHVKHKIEDLSKKFHTYIKRTPRSLILDI